MAVQYRTSDGCWSIEIVRLTGTPNKRDGEWIRIRQYGFYVTDLRSVAELERYVALAELEDALRTSGSGAVAGSGCRTQTRLCPLFLAGDVRARRSTAG
jgi:hypothetical protein